MIIHQSGLLPDGKVKVAHLQPFVGPSRPSDGSKVYKKGKPDPEKMNFKGLICLKASIFWSE